MRRVVAVTLAHRKFAEQAIQYPAPFEHVACVHPVVQRSGFLNASMAIDGSPIALLSNAMAELPELESRVSDKAGKTKETMAQSMPLLGEGAKGSRTAREV